MLYLYVVASVKIILRTNKKNADGKHPLAIQIIKDRKPSIIHLGHYLSENEWDEANKQVKKCHPNHARLNNLLRKKLAEASDKALELETQRDHVSSKAIKQKIKPNAGPTFAPQATSYLHWLKENGKYNQYSSDGARINVFKEFLEGGDIAFSDINVGLINRFKTYLKKRGISERTIANYMAMIRSVFNWAIKNEVVDAKYYPFGKKGIKIKFPESLKIGLTEHEVKALEDVVLESPYQHHARNLWLFSFYFAGMRVSDVFRLKKSDFQNGRLYYVMGKNTKGDSLKVPVKALAIVAQYTQESQYDLVFPELENVADINDPLEVQKKIKDRLHEINDQLRKVAEKIKLTKPLTMHISRHTFGNISGDKISIQMLQKLYRHTHISTTVNYQKNFIHKDADEALDAVLDFKV